MIKHKHNRLRPPYAWYGGKQWLGRIIYRYMPPHTRFVDLFTGSAAILFAKPPSPIEIINDLDSGVVTFFRVLRDPTKLTELRRLLTLTPYSREEFRHCSKHWEDFPTDVLRAWAWYVAVRQARNGEFGASWSREKECSSRGIPKNVGRWLSSIDRLPEIHARLQGVQIENLDFRRIIHRLDHPETWFYADPPYVWGTRSSGGYSHEMTDRDHVDLVGLLLDLKGMCLLSGYKTPLYEPLEENGWLREEFETVCFASPLLVQRDDEGSGMTKPKRVECLWLSPNLQSALNEARLKAA